MLATILHTMYTVPSDYKAPLNCVCRVHVNGSWECCGKNVAVSGQPGDMLFSRHPLPPLFSPEEVESARLVAPPTRDLFSDLEQWGIRKWAEEGEEERRRWGSRVFPHLHTLWVVDTAHLSEVQLLQRGLLFTFSRLVQQAVWQYGASVVRLKTLPAPLSGQCIVTNGQRLALLWLQVRSLRVEGEGEGEGEGGNVVAVERPGLLYEGTEMVRGRKRRCVVDFNENILRTLLATLLMH